MGRSALERVEMFSFFAKLGTALRCSICGCYTVSEGWQVLAPEWMAAVMALAQLWMLRDDLTPDLLLGFHALDCEGGRSQVLRTTRQSLPTLLLAKQ